MGVQFAGGLQEVLLMWAEHASPFMAPNLSLLLTIEISLKNSWHESGWFWLFMVLGILFSCCLLS